jgi:two-component SAPR family response regulator
MLMRVILVDDEELPLKHLKKLLEIDIGDVDVVGMFQNCRHLIDNIDNISPDVVFLDIQMHEISGLKLAEQIQRVNQDILIVFVTGYSSYALEAFDLSAVDYIMKPIRLVRLKKTVERLRKQISKHQKSTKKNENEIRLCCFNEIMLQRSGYAPELIKWRTTKAQELFAYLLLNREKVVDREILIELLWPDFDLSSGLQQLYTTIYHIRQLITKVDLKPLKIRSGKGGYTLHTGHIIIDTEEWEKNLNQLDELNNSNMCQHEKVFSQYKGDYLGNYGYIWAEGEKERLRRLWINQGLHLSSFYRKTDNVQAAIKVNQKIQQIYPEEEESYLELMKIYASINRFKAVNEQYQLLSSILVEEFNIGPSLEIRNWYENLISKPNTIGTCPGL